MRRLRKGDRVVLKPGIFLLQKTGETARVQFVYRNCVHVSPSLNGHNQFSAASLDRVTRDQPIPAAGKEEKQ